MRDSAKIKIFYLINSRIPTEKAEGVEAMKLCEAFVMTTDNHRCGATDGHGCGTTDNHGLLYEDITYKIRAAVFTVYNKLGFGHKELVYQKALEIEFRNQGLVFEPQKTLNVRYKGESIGFYKPDFVVKGSVIVEIKSSEFLSKADKSQILHYLKGTPYKLALLINFGAPKLDIERIVWFDGNEYVPNQRQSVNLRESVAANQRKSVEIEMVAPRRLNKIKEDPFAFYGIERNFKIVKLPVIDLIPFLSSKIIFWLEAFSFSVSVFLYLLIYSKKEDIIFSHDQISLFLISFLHKNVFYDIHDFPRGGFGLYGRLFKNLAGITTTNQWKREQLIKKFKLDGEKVFSWPNGVDLEKFDIKISKEDAREKLNLPQDKILVGYVGMLKTMGMGKGIETAIGALKFLPKNVMLVLVGGNREDVDEYKKAAEGVSLAERVEFIGWVKHELIPYYLKAFDVLIAPFPKNDHYEFYMCPMKIIEYMASKRPIVASDLNSIRELISEKESVLVQPESEEALASGIKEIIDNQQLAEEISSSAFNKARNFTWQTRAEKILNFIQSIIV